MLADDAAKHCCRNWLLFEGGAPFPVAAPTVVDAEGEGISVKSPIATIWRRHAARGGHDHHGFDGGITLIDAICLSLVFFVFGWLPAYLATHASLFCRLCFTIFLRRGAFQCPLFAPKLRGLPPSSHQPRRDGM